ncbi:LOW QUALITY PROTEIN: hypothetical protein V2J09_014397 [Rumex salicifolius]
MADQMEAVDIESVRSRISELSDALRNSNDFASLSASDSESLLREFVQSLELPNLLYLVCLSPNLPDNFEHAEVEQIVSEYSDVQFLEENDLSLYLEQLTAELKTTEAENNDLCNEIEELKQTQIGSACQLEGELETLNYALDNYKPMDNGEVRERAPVDGSNQSGTCRLSKEHDVQNFQELDLSFQIERSSTTLKELQDLDHILKKYEAIEKIEELFSGLKVIEFEGNNIRLSLKTYIPYVESLMHHQKLRDTVETSELNHELLIEVKSGSMELKNAEVFPNDVYIGDIFEAITSFSSQTDLAVVQTSSPLRWFLQKVQDRIVLCSLRQFMVKIANRSRHSLEYSDRDELIMACIRGIDAYIKPSQGWPMSNSVLKLISLKPSDHDAEQVSLRLLRISELSDALRNSNDFASLSASDSESLLREFVQSLEAEVEQIVSEYSDVQFLEENDLSLYLEQLTAELKTTEAENNDLCACQLEGELETLNYALDNYKPMDNGEVRERAPVDGSNQSGTCRLSKEHDEQNFQELDLSFQIERSSTTLKELQNLDHILKK